MKLIISVNEARKLLDSEYQDFTNEEIAKLIEHTHQFATLLLVIAKRERLQKNDPQ